LRLNWKAWALLPFFAWLAAGCGGFSASRSVSPASILLPGLLKAEPPPAPPEPDSPAEQSPRQVVRL